MSNQDSTKSMMQSLAAKSRVPHQTSTTADEHTLSDLPIDSKAPQLTPSVDLLEAFIKQSKPSQDLKHK